MAELTLISQDSGSLKPLIEGAISEALRLTETGIQRTERRIQEFEQKYQVSTQEFLSRYQNDEMPETLDLDEWIGETRMLQRLQDKADRLRGIEFAN
jgi:phage shock protein A